MLPLSYSSERSHSPSSKNRRGPLLEVTEWRYVAEGCHVSQNVWLHCNCTRVGGSWLPKLPGLGRLRLREVVSEPEGWRLESWFLLATCRPTIYVTGHIICAFPLSVALCLLFPNQAHSLSRLLSSDQIKLDVTGLSAESSNSCLLSCEIYFLWIQPVVNCRSWEQTSIWQPCEICKVPLTPFPPVDLNT